MCKLYRQSVEIHPGPDGQPLSFKWKDNWYLIERGYPYKIDKQNWQWYQSMGMDPYLERYRCYTDRNLDCDLVQEQSLWILERVWD
ncbi:hypothetical protein [Desulfotomaculum sp. 1211_IL3151]|uniref:hypothetical protein n=1 Tax=Desulfotomaculum sp. 1211_IL3151 TaxID=3084055 RepID=UPI002FDA29A0